MKYKPVIGLEIHAELKTKSKMFCSCPNDPNERHPNVNVCPICMGHPGTLPVANEEAIRKVIKTGLALNCQIPEKSKFDRKNYFYPDLPKGYQISQYDMPLSKGGYLNIGDKKIRITRVHLEEDTGRLVHPEDKNYSLVDFNRAGIPLMEMVTEPDLESGKEARKFAEEFQLILRYLGVSDADMEKGQLRVEVNISLMRNQKMGTKVEIKNLNSFRAVEKAIDYEIKRQGEVLNRGEKVVQETRGWDGRKELTVSQRKKEEAHDYRYFPEPDLPTFYLAKDFIDGIKAEIPELPQKRRERFMEQYSLNEKNAEIFTVNKNLGEFYENTISEVENWVKEARKKRKISDKEKIAIYDTTTQYVINDLQGSASAMSIIVGGEDFLITPENYAELITLTYEGKISSKIAKQVIEEMLKTGADPSHIIEEKGLTEMTDSGEIEKIIKDVVSKNKKAVEDYKEGKKNALQFLVGQVMTATRGRVKPDTVQQQLLKELSKK